jgi:hypothetical protein
LVDHYCFIRWFGDMARIRQVAGWLLWRDFDWLWCYIFFISIIVSAFSENAIYVKTEPIPN